MKKQGAACALSLLLLFAPPMGALALEAESLVPVGEAVGIRLETGGVLVAGLCEVETAEGPVRPAEAAGLQPGDVITAVEGERTASAAEFLSALTRMDGAPVTLTAKRSGREAQFTVTPVQNAEGVWQMGLWLRDGVTGIGTVTFYDPVTGVFGALGHGVNDLDSGALVPLEGGAITDAEVVDVVRGERGSPGELCGEFDGEAVRGTLEKNTDGGIFGVASWTAAGEPVPVATEAETALGEATILCNVSGDRTEEYRVEISRIYRGAEDHRFLMLTVTDPALLEKTGGIVQGMSGSPILQNGKLVGAVTHVLISDPTRGYGISMEDMLAAA